MSHEYDICASQYLVLRNELESECVVELDSKLVGESKSKYNDCVTLLTCNTNIHKQCLE